MTKKNTEKEMKEKKTTTPDATEEPTPEATESKTYRVVVPLLNVRKDDGEVDRIIKRNDTFDGIEQGGKVQGDGEYVVISEDGVKLVEEIKEK